MPPLTKWNRLIRYVSAKDGSIRYGEPISDVKADIDQLVSEGRLEVQVLDGDTYLTLTHSGEKDQVKELLGPLTWRDVPILRCVGINYTTHSTFAASTVLHIDGLSICSA